MTTTEGQSQKRGPADTFERRRWLVTRRTSLLTFMSPIILFAVAELIYVEPSGVLQITDNLALTAAVVLSALIWAIVSLSYYVPSLEIIRPEIHFKKLTVEQAVNEYEWSKIQLYVVGTVMVVFVIVGILFPPAFAQRPNFFAFWLAMGVLLTLSAALIWKRLAYLLPRNFWLFASEAYMKQSQSALGEHWMIYKAKKSIDAYDSYLKRLLGLRIWNKDAIIVNFLDMSEEGKRQFVEKWVVGIDKGPMEPLRLISEIQNSKFEEVLKHESLSQKIKGNAIIPIVVTISATIASFIFHK